MYSLSTRELRSTAEFPLPVVGPCPCQLYHARRLRGPRREKSGRDTSPRRHRGGACGNQRACQWSLRDTRPQALPKGVSPMLTPTGPEICTIQVPSAELSGAKASGSPRRIARDGCARVRARYTLPGPRAPRVPGKGCAWMTRRSGSTSPTVRESYECDGKSVC